MVHKDTILRFFIAFLVIVLVLAIFVWNISLCQKQYIDQEIYRTLVHEAVKQCVMSDAIEDPILALCNITNAREQLHTAAKLCGGFTALRFLTGLDISDIDNKMERQEGQVRKYLTQKGLLKKHPLSPVVEEEAEVEADVVSIQEPQQKQTSSSPLQDNAIQQGTKEEAAEGFEGFEVDEDMVHIV